LEKIYNRIKENLNCIILIILYKLILDNGLLINERSKKMKIINTIALILVIVGGLNWGLIGFFNFNLVDFLFGAGSFLSKIVYILVGIASLWCISLFAKIFE